MRFLAVPPLLGATLIALTSTIAASGVDKSFACDSSTSCLSANQSAPSGSSGAAIKGTATNSYGLRGVSTNSSGTIGSSGSGTMLSPGVEGESTATSGSADVAGGFGLTGLSGRAPGYGVYAVGASTGVFGELAASGGGKAQGAGVVGYDATGTYAGVVGESATGYSNPGIGVTGVLAPVKTAHTGVGVFGSSGYTAYPADYSTGYGFGGFFDGFSDANTPAIGLEAESNALAAIFYDADVDGNDSSSSVLLEQAGTMIEADVQGASGGNATAQFKVDDSGNVRATGTITAKASVTDGEAAFRQTGASGATMTAYGMRAAEPELEDVGEAQLVDGRAIVQIDAKLGDVMDSNSRYHVFLTPEGDSKGLYVARKTRTSFVVAEQQGGRSSMAFDYRIVATPYGHHAARLATMQPERTDVSRFMSRTRRGSRNLALPTPPEQRLRATLGSHAYASALAKKQFDLSH